MYKIATICFQHLKAIINSIANAGDNSRIFFYESIPPLGYDEYLREVKNNDWSCYVHHH